MAARFTGRFMWGNHRWDTCVFVNESGAYSAVFRHSFRKKVIEDGKDPAQRH